MMNVYVEKNEAPTAEMEETPIGRTRQVGSDPWKYRSAGMKCRTCMWNVAKSVVVNPHAPETDRGRIGRCRRHAPTMSGYPVVFETDWCGDHKLDETKA